MKTELGDSIQKVRRQDPTGGPDYKQKKFPSLFAFLSDEEATEYNQEVEKLKKELEKEVG